MSDAPAERRPRSSATTRRAKDLILTLAAAIVVTGLAGAAWSLTQANWVEALGAAAAAGIGVLLYRWRWPRRRRIEG